MQFRSLRCCIVLGVLAATSIGCGSSDNNGGGNGGGLITTGAQCSNTGGGFGLECQAIIDIRNVDTGLPAQTIYAVNTGDISSTGVQNWNFSIRNLGNGGLVIAKMELLYEAKSPAEAQAPAFTCLNAAGQPCDKAPWAVVQPADEGGVDARFTVGFKAQNDELKREAVLRITSNAEDKQVVIIRFTTAAGTAKISVKPEMLDFGFVQIGDEKIVEVRAFNIGNSPLIVSGMDLTTLDGELFTIIVDNVEYKGGTTVSFDPAVTVQKNSSFAIKGLYKGKDDLPHNGTVLLATNDNSLVTDGAPGQKAVNVKVNSTGPCLIAKPQNVVFGGTAIGTKGVRPLELKSCGDAKVEITDVVWAAPGAGEFAIDWSSLSTGAGKAPNATNPLIIDVNQSVTVNLTYQPEGANPVKDGIPVADTAKIVLSGNIATKTMEVTVEGVAANADCPTAIITVQEGDSVVPQTMLHLSGTQSFAPGQGGITKYAWEVIQPKGSVGLFVPSASAPDVTFQPNVAGEYEFRLRVWDAAGKESCFPGVKVVTVLPDDAIHVELLWDTPADKDQADEGPAAGADLDLHFSHSYASVLDFDGDGANDPWFDAKYDCFWFNKGPEWGSYDPNVDDNPSLDRDDTDGAGPENLNLTLPEDGKEYGVGVHYFNDNGWGPSVAEVRVYIYGQLQFQVSSKPLTNGDMWYVADIQWPSGAISSKLNADKKPFFVTPKYPAPEL
ncbi:MAG: hypothetical protein CMH53_04975 [Myxococcales bacterium]|nr:hypothetical protein [Myxococcales bacterium]